MTNTTTERGDRKTFQAKVVSDKMDKTIVVQVERTVKHPLYGKFMKRRKKFYAHDETNDAREGDTVIVVESRPLSRLKRWRLRQIVERAK